MPQKKRNKGDGSGGSTPEGNGQQFVPSLAGELVVVAKRDAGLRVRSSGVEAAEADVAPLTSLLQEAHADLKPLFGATEERLQHEASLLPAAQRGEEVPDLSVFYRVDAADDEDLHQLATELLQQEAVEAAYVKPQAELPQPDAETPTMETAAALNDMLPSPVEPPTSTPDFTARQGYLNAAPGGVDARWAWTQPGGRGTNVRIIDIEGAWRFTHEDLLANQGGVVGGIQTGDLGWRNHGTAVVGVFGGDVNSRGITGISPDAHTRAISCFGIFGVWVGSAGPIRDAANALGPGDVILIELHRPGPRFNYAQRDDQQGYIAIEWWPDDYEAIRYAIGRGVIVVEAAGNGAQNLDDPIYDSGPGWPFGFPSWWRNPFRRSPLDSGAILVGAGAPPNGAWGPDRSRLGFSNFGAAVDAQGWGAGVTTVGYGNLQGGANEDTWYTDSFSGTSSASPIVVGSLACVQGNLRARGITPLTPASARNLLRTTGSPQQDAPGRPATQRIGNRPNTRQMIERFATVSTAPLYRYWNPTIRDHFYTTNWAELGWGNYGWSYERIQGYVWSAQRPGTTALYRYWNPTIGDHFYTTNWAELGWGNYGWSYERIQGYVWPTQQIGTVPLYRYWNPTVGDHFYTTNWAELGWGNHGWTYERIQCYVHAQQTTAQAPAAPPGGGTTPEAPPMTGPLDEPADPVEAQDANLPPGTDSPRQPPDTFTSEGARGPRAPGEEPEGGAGPPDPATFMTEAPRASFATEGLEEDQHEPPTTFRSAQPSTASDIAPRRQARTRITIDIDPDGQM
jgi:hypothetical protein